MSDDSTGRILAALERLEQGQSQLRTDLMARMDRLQDALTDIRDDIGVNMQHSDRVRLAHDHTREEMQSLSSEVAVLHRKVRQLEAQVRELRGEP